jgi:serine/threonine protein kinase
MSYFNSVYKAVNSSGVIAACKVIAITRTTPTSARKAIEKEVSVHGSLRHSNIVEMMAAMMVEDEDGVQYVPGAYLLLEMAHGGDLFDKIGRFSTTTSMEQRVFIRFLGTQLRTSALKMDWRTIIWRNLLLV